MEMLMVVLLLLTVKPEAVQLVVDRLLFCCRTKAVEGEGQETITLLAKRVTVSNGAPDVCTTDIRIQKPPVTAKFPPLIPPPASGWPMVPLTENTPPVLVPPPPEIFDQSME